MESVIRELWRQLPDLRAEMIVLAKEQGVGLRELARSVGVNHAYIIRLSKQTDPQTAAQLLTQAAIDGKITPAQLAALLGIPEHKARQTVQRNQPKNPKKGGRPTALTPEIKELLARLEADPATQHLSNRSKYLILCQKLGPENLPSYHTIHRYLESLPQAFTRTKRTRILAAHHTSNILPGEVWLVDRYDADIEVIDLLTGKKIRPEVAVVIDKATRAILAIGAAHRPEAATLRKQYHFDSYLLGCVLLQAVRGELTNAPHYPQRLLIDWGKVENAQPIIDYFTYNGTLIERARPYNPNDKPEIEGGVIAHIHTQLEARLPGYKGNDPKNPPACYRETPKTLITAKGVYYTDNTGRPYLTIDEYNQALQEYAQQWNQQPDATDIRYRNIPRIARLQPLRQHPRADQTQQHYAETYLLPQAVRKVYNDGTIRLANRVYYHPALCALHGIYGDKARVVARYSLTNRQVVYLYHYDHEREELTREWLWHFETDDHPWHKSQATLYDRWAEEHHEYHPYHQNWETLTRAVNRAVMRALKEVQQNPILNHRLLFNYVASHAVQAAEKHLPNLLQSSPHHNPTLPLREGQGVRATPQGVEAGATHTDAPSGTGTAPPGPPHLPRLSGEEGSGKRTDARPALINAQQHNHPHPPLPHTGEGQGNEATIDPWEIEKRAMQKLREEAAAWRKRFINGQVR